MRKVTKLFISKAQSIDEKNMTATFKISDGQADRMGEIVDQKSWNFKSYMENPILLWGHDPSSPENVLGTALSLEYDDKADATFATVKFDKDINSKAELIFNQVARGTLRAVSVGMIVHAEDKQGETPVLKDCELLEISVVPIPANPRAVALAYTEGSISRKDATFLKDSMEKEIELLQKELDNDTKELSMDELTKAIADLTTAVTAQGQVLASIDENVKKMVDDEAAEDGAEGDGEDAADGGADDSTENPDGTPKKGAKVPKKKSEANDGSNDQSGAENEDDEAGVDEDTELTEEQQKEFDAAFTKELADLQVK